MKYLIFCILTLSVLNAKAQKKISYDLLFDAGIVFSKSNPVTKSTPGFALYDPNNGTITFIPGVIKTTNEYKNIITPKISLGARANYPLNQNFKIYAGLSFSYLKAKRKNTMFFPGFSPNAIYEYTTIEIFNFYNLDIPLGATYIYNKWSLNFGITPSIILDSKLTQIKKPVDAEIEPVPPGPLHPLDPQPSPDNKTKSFISLSISPLYQLSERLKIGIEYNHGLTNSYSSDVYSTDVYQSMKTSTLGLKMLYKIK